MGCMPEWCEGSPEDWEAQLDECLAMQSIAGAENFLVQCEGRDDCESLDEITVPVTDALRLEGRQGRLLTVCMHATVRVPEGGVELLVSLAIRHGGLC